MIHFCRVLALLLSLSPAAIRAGLWLKSLRLAKPRSTLAWCLAAAAMLHFVVYATSTVFTDALMLQMCGDLLLTVAAFLFISAPAGYVIGLRRFARAADAEALFFILVPRGVHLLIFLIGLNVFIVFISTRTLEPGAFRLIGFDAATALFQPGTVIQMMLEFLARSLVTSILALDLLEGIVAQANGKK